jgi:hypothetical protein
MRQPEIPLCTIYERGRVVGFVLDRGITGFESYDADERSLRLFDTGAALRQPCGSFGRTPAADCLLLRRHNSVANTGS